MERECTMCGAGPGQKCFSKTTGLPTATHAARFMGPAR